MLEEEIYKAKTDLLDCIACLDPRNEFSNFDVHKLGHLAHLYPKDFSYIDHTLISQELQTFLSNVRSDKQLFVLQIR